MTKGASGKRRDAGVNSGGMQLHKAGHDPRAAALVGLSRVLDEGVDAQAAVDAALSSPHLVPTDKRLCTELTYGALRWHLRLGLFSNRFLQKPEKLPAEMRLTLHLALYEMAFLRIPHHATVNWAVSHVRNRFGRGLGGVANGVLRAMQRAMADFAHPERYAERPEEESVLACRYAIPEWIVRLWRHHCGPETARLLLEASQTAPPSGLRLNRARPDWAAAREALLREGNANAERRGGQAGEHAGPGARETSADAASSQGERHGAGVTAVGECGLAFAGSLPWQAKQLLSEGRASRQSAASYEALAFFDPADWKGPVWDCCAGRGGKTLALLEQGVAVALASDTSARRLDGLATEYARLGLSHPPCPVVLERSACAPDPLPDSLPREFGVILVDAPCSGLGTLSRHPEIRLRRTPDDLARLAELQGRILSSVWRRLAPGGLLIYITCTVNPAENEDRIAHFLAATPGAALWREFRTPAASPLGEFFYGAALRRNPGAGAM